MSAELQQAWGLVPDERALVISVISRSPGEGARFVAGSLPRLVADGIQVVIRGTGDRSGSRLPPCAAGDSGRVGVHIVLTRPVPTPTVAEPTRLPCPRASEPCGLNRMACVTGHAHRSAR